MSKKIPSQGLNFNFEIVLDKEKETRLQRIKRWIKKQRSPLNIILLYFFSYFEEWYLNYKVERTMRDVDSQVDHIKNIWDEEDKINEPIIESKPSEVVGLDEIRIRNSVIPDPWDGDWNDYYNFPNKINKESNHE